MCRIAIENDNDLYVLLFIIDKFVDILDNGYGLKFELVFEPPGKDIAYYGAYSVFDFLVQVGPFVLWRFPVPLTVRQFYELASNSLHSLRGGHPH